MSNIINASNTGLQFSSDKSGLLELQNNGTTLLAGDVNNNLILSDNMNSKNVLSATYPLSVYVYSTVNQSIPANTWTKCVFGTVGWDTNGVYSTVNNRITPGIAGIYQLAFSFGNWANATTSNYQLAIGVNGNLIGFNTTLASNGFTLNGSGLINIGTTDYIELFAYNSNATNTGAGQSTNYLACWLRR